MAVSGRLRSTSRETIADTELAEREKVLADNAWRFFRLSVREPVASS